MSTFYSPGEKGYTDYSNYVIDFDQEDSNETAWKWLMLIICELIVN